MSTSLYESSSPLRTPAEESHSGSLSPSRAADFKVCPLLYRLRSIDRLPEPPSVTATRGTLVHAVLDRLFDLPPAQRQRDMAQELIAPEWEKLREQEPDVAELFASAQKLTEWLSSACDLVHSYFSLEDPALLEPAEREALVEAELPSGLHLRGIVDRLDINPAGHIRVVDYKTGGAPREAFEAKALFQLKFYALVLWRTRGVVPTKLRLLYLADCEILDYAPTETELAAFERTVEALWQAIGRCMEKREFRPKPSALCNWCPHKPVCPAHGGTPPQFPAGVEPLSSLSERPESREPA